MLREPEITLFGRKISLPEKGVGVAVDGQSSGEDSNESNIESGDCDRCLEVSRGQEAEEAGMEETLEQRDEEQAAGEASEPPSAENEGENEELSVSHNTNGLSDVVSGNEAKSEDEESGATNSNSEQKTTLKKPDKILPCPRCNSMDTKFCYYNNYNVNQPRHFCKSCQRYWTAGGTMRNVPVGAGRRKNKAMASHCRHITITEALQAAAAAPNGLHKPNGTVLSFGPDSPMCEPMSSAMSLAENKLTNGYHKINQGNPDGGFQNTNGFPAPVPCIPGVPWPFPWNNGAIYPPLPYYTATPFWNLPWLSVPSQNTPNSPLGKRSRDEEPLNPITPEGRESQKRKGSESSIVIPKTLRIDDPEEAAKSSIWSTLGICREGLFKALQPKGDEKKAMAMGMATTSPLLQANPAALSRSLKFQERA